MSDLGVDPDRHDLPCGGCDGEGYTFTGSYEAVWIPDFAEPAGTAVRTFTCGQ
jgi:hypothetical protein